MEKYSSHRLFLILIGVLSILSSVHRLYADSDHLQHQFPDPMRSGVTNEKNILHITRLSVALLSAKIDSFRYGADISDQDLALLSKEIGNYDRETIEDVFESLSRVCHNDSNGNFRIYAAGIHYAENCLGPSNSTKLASICISGLVHGIGTEVQIYKTHIAHVIGFKPPMAPGESMTCFVNNADAIANFLKAYYDKPVVVLDED